MPTPFDPADDFNAIVTDIGFPGNVTVRQINRDTGNTTTTANSVPAVGRTLDGTPAAVGENGEIYPKSKRWWLRASDITWTLGKGDHVVSGGGLYTIESARLVAFDAAYVCESHYLGTS